ncbi:hypothetical protein D9M71_494510 [compost metagenome]
MHLAVGIQFIVESLGLAAEQHAFGRLQQRDLGQIGGIQTGVLDQHAGIAAETQAHIGEIGGADDHHVRLDQDQLPVDAGLVAEIHRQRQPGIRVAQAMFDEVWRSEGVDGADQHVHPVAIVQQGIDQRFGAAGKA